MRDRIATRAGEKDRLAGFAPRMGRRHANGCNIDFGPGPHQAVTVLLPHVRRRPVL